MAGQLPLRHPDLAGGRADAEVVIERGEVMPAGATSAVDPTLAKHYLSI